MAQLLWGELCHSAAPASASSGDVSPETFPAPRRPAIPPRSTASARCLQRPLRSRWILALHTTLPNLKWRPDRIAIARPIRPAPVVRRMAEPRNYEPFPSTSWSLVGQAGHDDPAVQRAALAELLQRYLGPLRCYLVTVRHFPDDRAADLLQGFLVSKVLEEELLRHADQSRGKFRTFLLTALDHFIVSEHRLESARKRRPDQASDITLLPAEPSAPHPRPEAAFDLAWAREILAQAIARMKDECLRTTRPDIWGIFQQRILAPFSLEPGPAEELSYDQLVARFELKSPAQAANILITAKRMFARSLRAVIAEYEPDESRIDAEIADLRQILARPTP